jgi:hypothetical protein
MNRRKTNGHAEPQDRVNGHSAGAAIAAQRAQVRAAKTASPGEKESSGKTEKDSVHFPGPTNSEAMQDAGAYVNAVVERVDLVAASVRLVESGDQKIAKAELDRLRDMKFGKVGPAAVEEQAWPELGDLPRPPR